MFYQFACDLARRAGAILREGVGQRRSVTSKGDADVVTDIDRASEALILAAIREQFPEHAIVAEESGGERVRQGYTWLIDPLDGTLNYLHGLPIYAVSIGLLLDGEPLIGAVYDPTRDELFSAERGRGAFLNGEPIRVSAIDQLSKSLLTTGFPYERARRSDNNLRQFAHLLMLVQDIRRPGSAAIDLCYAAAGRSEGHWELGLKPWDVAAGALILSEAGGQLSGWRGEPWQVWDEHLVATNGHLHAALVAELHAASEG